MTDTPCGELSIRTIAMPADTNPGGTIFGGWVMSQMDLAGGTAAVWRAKGAVVTVSVDAMTFHEPVLVGDEFSCYTRLLKVGRTSLVYHIESWIRRRADEGHRKVTEGTYTYVAIDENRKPRLVPAQWV